MKKSMPRFLTLFLCAFTLMSCAKDSIEEEITPYDHQATNVVLYSYDSLELDILEEINAYRKSQGLNELEPLAEISLEAEDHTVYMLGKGKVSHDNFQIRHSSLVRGIGAKSVSENVAYGYRTAEAVVKAWIKSDDHRKNLKGNHSHFGISVLDDENGRNYFTNIFVRK